jgi:hypothetical protein
MCRHGYTALHAAAEDGRLEISRLLLLHDADVNAKTDTCVARAKARNIQRLLSH